MNATTIVLRTIALLMGVALFVWAFYLYREGAGDIAVAIVALEGLLIAVGVIFEKRRYRPDVDLTQGEWLRTGEKFKDPSTGKLLDVVYNPKTGKRDYVEIKP